MQLAGPVIEDKQFVWAAFAAAAGLAGPVEIGSEGTLYGAGPAVVEWMHAPTFLGVRTADGLFMFIHGYKKNLVVQYHVFSPEVSEEKTEAIWRDWLDGFR